MKKTLYIIQACTVSVLIGWAMIVLGSHVSADTASTASNLQQQIDDHTTQITQLKAEINQYQKQLDQAAAQAKTLQSAVNTLTTNGKKIDTSIQLTQNQLQTANLTISQLSSQISDKQAHISASEKALAEMISQQNQTDSESFLKFFLNIQPYQL